MTNDDIERLLADAATEDPPARVRERVFRRRPMWIAAAAVLFFAATLWLVLRDTHTRRIGGMRWVERPAFGRIEARDVLVVDGDILVAGDHWWQAPGGPVRARHESADPLRSASLVLTAPDVSALRKGLEAAVAQPRADVRVAALRALGRIYETWAVELALPFAKDPDPRVRRAARESMRATVASPHDCDTHDYAAWWNELDGEQRRGLFELQWTEALQKGTAGRCACGR